MKVNDAGRPDGGAWRTQADDYGRRFGAIYDVVFPMDSDATATADRLYELGTTVTAAGLASTRPTFVEFGVGSGRVALPLAVRGAKVTGIDRSPELLASARRRVSDNDDATVDLVRADIRSWHAATPADVAYCICGTLSMLEQESDQRLVLRNMMRSVHSRGLVVVETHSPDRIRSLHRNGPEVEFDTVVPGLAGGLHSRSVLYPDSTAWSVHHSWAAPEPASAIEYSRLIDPETLVRWAAGEGLELVSLSSGWSSQPLDPVSPTYVCVLRPVDTGPSATRPTAGPTGAAESRWTP